MERLHTAGWYASLRAREPRQRLSFPPASWDRFRDRFHPMARHDGSLLWSGSDIPARLGYRHVWTVTERNGDPCVVPGRRLLDARGYLLTAVPWPGLQDQQPVYAFPAPIVLLNPAPALGSQAVAS
jgi:hypothetical protein